MKSSSPDADEALDRLLGTWRLEAELPERCRAEVWQRISGSRKRASLSLWTATLVWLDQSLRRPWPALTSIGVSVLLGVLAGYLHLRVEKKSNAAEMSTRYVQQVDPYQTVSFDP